jgi:hypothetical protein
MKFRLVDNWRHVLLRSWAVRMAAFWGAVCALYAIWPVFSDILPTWAYVIGAVLLGVSIALARATDQPGSGL